MHLQKEWGIDMKAINVEAVFPMYQTNKFSYIITPKIGIWTTNPNTYFLWRIEFQCSLYECLCLQHL